MQLTTSNEIEIIKIEPRNLSFMANSVGGGSTSPTSPSSSSSSSPSSPPLIVLISEKQFQIQQQQKQQQQQQQLASLSSPPLSPTNKQYSSATPTPTTPTMPKIVEQQVYITSDVRPQVVPLSLSVSISMPSSSSLASMSLASSSPPSLRSNLVSHVVYFIGLFGSLSSKGSKNDIFPKKSSYLGFYFTLILTEDTNFNDIL